MTTNDVGADTGVQRRCIVCRKGYNKRDILRLVLDEDAIIWPDMFQKAPGRGAYLCMQNNCLQKVNDKCLHHAWRKQHPLHGQCAALATRMMLAVTALCRQYAAQQKSCAATGRDAVMRRLQHTRPALVVMADDAGGALLRQISIEVDKRQVDGVRTEQIVFPSASLLGSACGREKVSVMALDISPAVEKLWHYCAWHKRLKESGYDKHGEHTDS